ncbi:MAG: hypothetical protein IJ341_04015 [Bacteroidales bacterium]|nr:hypothetical protein [Bacteroidales bacterium]
MKLEFTKESMLKQVENYSAMVGANRNVEGANLFDALRMTSDDIIIFDSLFKESFIEIWRRLYSWIQEADYGDVKVYMIIEDKYNSKIVQSQIKEFLYSSILAKWFTLKGSSDAEYYAFKAGEIKDNITMLFHNKLYRRKSNPF